MSPFFKSRNKEKIFLVSCASKNTYGGNVKQIGRMLDAEQSELAKSPTMIAPGAAHRWSRMSTLPKRDNNYHENQFDFFS